MTSSATDTQYATMTDDGKYVVGGMVLDRPFRIRRLGHFGFDMENLADGVKFYNELLGFEFTDIRDVSGRMSDEQQKSIPGPHKMYFCRYGTDHHAMVIANKSVKAALARPGRPPVPGVTINQITWQVSSLAEVGDAIRYFSRRNSQVVKVGRDMPGSNWHVYLNDPEGHTNELYYGIEQIGWDSRSKPWDMHDRSFVEAPPLPQMSEWEEVNQAIANGADFGSAYRPDTHAPHKYDVQGITLPRPFKVVRLGPVRLFLDDVDATADFYINTLGFTLTETVTWKGHTCLFLRCGTEHTAVGLYPMALRKELGLSEHTSCMSMGLQVANYQQLRDARDYLKENGVKLIDLPHELFPGVDYQVNAIDPDGHMIQLYDYIEQIGWDGKPRPQSERRKLEKELPETLDPNPDSFTGEPFFGPWG